MMMSLTMTTTNMLTSTTKQRDREDYLEMVSIFGVAVILYKRTFSERSENAVKYFAGEVERIEVDESEQSCFPSLHSSVERRIILANKDTINIRDARDT